jgi:PAS domain S-box-containing protein
MVWDWDLKTNTLHRNAEKFVRILKLPVDQKDSSNEYWLSRIHPDDIEDLHRFWDHLQKDPGQNTFEIEYRFLCGDNKYIYMCDRGYVVRDEEGKISRIIGAAQDINEKKLADVELKKLSLIAKEIPISVIITDTHGNVIWVNEAFTQITEYTLDEIIGKKPGDFLQGKESDNAAIEYMSQQISKRLPFKSVILNYSKSGRKYWVEINAQPIFDDHNRFSHFFAIQTDITERLIAEEAIKKSEEEYRSLFNNNPASIFIWNLNDLSISVVNDTAVKQFGYSREEFLQLTIADLRPLNDISKIKNFAKGALNNKEFKANEVWKHLDKMHNEIFMEISSHRIIYNNEPAIFAIAINVTEKILLENKLSEEKIKKHREITQAVILAQEKERKLIGSELHDNINQILAGSRLYLGLVKSEKEDYNPFLNEIDKLIILAIEEIRKLSHSLIPPSMEDDEFMDAINSIIEMTTIGNQFVIEKMIEIVDKSKFTDELHLTIYRIIQEQFNNILKYAKPNRVWLKLYQLGDKIMLSIKDDGVGFDTKSRTPGVGLMNIKTRASLFNGELTIISAPGKGCEINICFN